MGDQRETEGGEPRDEVSLLRDAAVVFNARREIDTLVGRLAVEPFDATVHSDLRHYLDGPADQAVLAWQRLRDVWPPQARTGRKDASDDEATDVRAAGQEEDPPR